MQRVLINDLDFGAQRGLPIHLRARGVYPRDSHLPHASSGRKCVARMPIGIGSCVDQDYASYEEALESSSSLPRLKNGRRPSIDM